MKKKIYIILFACILILPSVIWMFVKNQVDTDTTENRALSEKPEFDVSNIDSYPKLYEEYYNDHLPFKSFLVHSRAVMSYKVFKEVSSEKVLLGKENWLFYKGEPGDSLQMSPVADYQGTNLYSEEQLSVILDNVEAGKEYFENKNIQFSILICPDKEQVYSQYIPDSVQIVEEKGKVERLIDYLNENGNVHIFNPYDELKKYKDKYQVYYKYDTHWNMLGGFIANQEIREYYCKEKNSLDEFEIGVREEPPAVNDLGIMLDLKDYFSDDAFVWVSNYKPDVEVEVVEFSDDGGFIRSYHSNAKDKRTVMVIRDSYGEQLCDYMAKDYANVVFIHRDVFKEEYIDQYNPDVVIFECVERTTDSLGTIKALLDISE